MLVSSLVVYFFYERAMFVTCFYKLMVYFMEDIQCLNESNKYIIQ